MKNRKYGKQFVKRAQRGWKICRPISCPPIETFELTCITRCMWQ